MKKAGLALILVVSLSLSGCSLLMTAFSIAQTLSMVPNTSMGNTGSSYATIQVANRTNQTIYYLYASPCDQNGWGSDRLGSSVISSGGSYTLQLEPGCWDFRASTQEGAHSDVRNQRVQAGQGYTLSVNSF